MAGNPADRLPSLRRFALDKHACVGEMAALQEIAIGRIGIERGTSGDQRRYGGAILGLRCPEMKRIRVFTATPIAPAFFTSLAG